MVTLRDRLLNVVQVKNILGCSKSHVYNLINIGELLAVKIGDKHGLRVKEGSLDDFMKRRSVTVGE